MSAYPSIRSYQPADVDDVVEIWRAAAAIAHPFLKPEFVAKEAEQIRNIYVSLSKISIWQDETGSQGYIAMIENEIGGLFVRPEAQRRGIGMELVHYVASSHETLEVEVFERNPIGRAFYEKAGFSDLLQTYEHQETGEVVLRLRRLG